jgi:hypothetical protein
MALERTDGYPALAYSIGRRHRQRTARKTLVVMHAHPATPLHSGGGQMKVVSTKIDAILCKEESAIIGQVVDAAVSQGIDRLHVERTMEWCSFVSKAARLSTGGRTKGDGWQATALKRTSGVYIEVSDTRMLADVLGIPKDADCISILNTLSMIAVRFESDWREFQGVVVSDLCWNGKELAFTYVPVDVVLAEQEADH